MEKAAFLEAIRAQPDDDVVRLVYADWLEERGEPLGAFIRAQVRLAQLPKDDPEVPGLRALERELLEAHRAEWLAGSPTDVSECEFRRGFVASAAVNCWCLYENETYARSVADAFPLLEEVRVEECEYPSFERAAPAVGVLASRLNRLTLAGSPGSDVGALAEVGPCPRLEHLGLSHTGAWWGNVLDLVSSPNLPALATLDVSHNDIDLAWVVHADGNHPRPARPSPLRSLNLSGNPLTSEFLGELGAMAPLFDNLTELDLSHNPRFLDGWEWRSDEELEHSWIRDDVWIPDAMRRILGQLDVLNLSNCGFSDESKATLRAVFGGCVLL